MPTANCGAGPAEWVLYVGSACPGLNEFVLEDLEEESKQAIDQYNRRQEKKEIK